MGEVEKLSFRDLHTENTECFIGKRKTSMRQFKLVLISFSSGIFLKESLQFLFPKSSYLNTECY